MKGPWRPTNQKDQGLEESFLGPVKRNTPVNTFLAAPPELSARSGSALSARSSKKEIQAITNRLYNDAKIKELKKTHYSKEKIARDLARCTFMPNSDREKDGAATHRVLDSTQLGASKKLQVSIFRGLQSGEEDVSVKVQESVNRSRLEMSQTMDNPSEKGLDSFLEKKKQQRLQKSRSGTALQLQQSNNDFKHLAQAIEGSDSGAKQDSKNKKDKSAKKNKLQSKDVLYEYLAYEGLKNQRSEKLENMKSQRELAQCTFKPEIISNSRMKERRSGKIYDQLLKKQKNYQELEMRKAKHELKQCSFRPQIDNKSVKMIDKIRRDNETSYEQYHKKHVAQIDKVKAYMNEKDRKEME